MSIITPSLWEGCSCNQYILKAGREGEIVMSWEVCDNKSNAYITVLTY